MGIPGAEGLHFQRVEPVAREKEQDMREPEAQVPRRGHIFGRVKKKIGPRCAASVQNPLI